MTSEKCPQCDLTLNEQSECAQCGLTYTPVVLEQAAGDEPPAPSASVVPEVVAELNALVAGWVEPGDGDAQPPADGDAAQPAPRDFAEAKESSHTDADDGWLNAEAPDDARPEEAGGEDDMSPASPAGVSSVTNISDQGRVRDVIHAHDSHIITNYLIGPQQSKEDDERPLFELTEVLPLKRSNLPEFVSEELAEYVEKLREERLVLLSCPDEDIAFAAAHALIDGLHLPLGEQRRLLNVERSVGEGPPLSVYNLRRKSKHDKEAVVLVDATTEKAQQFLEPVMTAGRAASVVIQDDLRRNELYMICLVDLAPAEAEPQADDGRPRQARELKFPCWRIPFLRRLLERYQVEQLTVVESEIETQRQLGWWSPYESEFYFELKTLLLRRELQGEIARRAEAPPPGPVNELFKGDDPLSDTVLYVATFFPNLTPYEFNQVVPLILGGASRITHNEGNGQSKNGARAAEPATEGKTALQVWRELPDQVLKKCELVTIPLRDATKGVNFSNHGLRDKLREYLEREYSFFLENRFQDVQELGLIFSLSAKIAQSAMNLSVEMAVSYPEYYGSRWLSGVVTDFEAAVARTDGTEAQTWRFIQEANAAKARKRFYQSLSELVRAMLNEPRLTSVVEEFVQQLLLSKHHTGVLELVRRLYLAPAFDQFKWLKQLFHRGDQQIREETDEYLRGYLKRAGGRVYQALSSLESWLPERDRPLRSYPVSARYALRLSLVYLSETTSRFDARYYGAWPSAFPLFAFQDAETATDNLSLLIRLLFHPGMKGVFKEQRIGQNDGDLLINRMITDWFFILHGTGEQFNARRGDGADEDEPQFDAAAAARLLLEQIVRTAPAPQQGALLKHWREENRAMLKALSYRPYGSPAWEELACKRTLLVELITSYEQLRSDAAA